MTTEVKIPIIEFFISTQGEGISTGLPVMFIRSWACDASKNGKHCSFCDTKFSWEKGTRVNAVDMTPSEIVKKAKEISKGLPLRVVISGGNPALWDFTDVIKPMKELGYTFEVETQGTKFQPWFNLMDAVTVSPKPPSSGRSFDEPELDYVIDNTTVPTVLKIVVGDEADYEFAKMVFDKYPQITMRYISTLTLNTDNPNQQDLIDGTRRNTEYVLADERYDISISMQFHQLLWPGQTGV